MLRTNLSLKYSENKGEMRGLSMLPASLPNSDNKLPAAQPACLKAQQKGCAAPLRLPPVTDVSPCRKTLSCDTRETKGERGNQFVIPLLLESCCGTSAKFQLWKT